MTKTHDDASINPISILHRENPFCEFGVPPRYFPLPKWQSNDIYTYILYIHIHIYTYIYIHTYVYIYDIIYIYMDIAYYD